MSFFDDASLAFLPSGAAGKDGKAYSIKPTNGDGDFTFSRGSNLSATRVGADGLIEKGRENLFLQSNQFDTTWVNYLTTETSGQSGYDGSSDAWLLTKSGANGTIYQNKSSSGVQTISVYAKKNTNSWLQIYAVGSPNVRAYYDLENGVLGGYVFNAIEREIEDVGNGWYRCSVTFNSSLSSIRLYPSDGNNDESGTSGSIYIQDSQLEIGLAATEVISTGATTGKAGLLEDEPRFDYSGDCPSLLLEPSRTNLIPYSEYLTNNNSFSSINVTLESGFYESPEGLSNAYKWTTTNPNSNAFVDLGRFNTTIGTTYSFSFYLKSDASNVNVKCSFTRGTTEQIIAELTTEWKRFDITFTADNSDKDFLILLGDYGITNPAQTIFVYGIMQEAGSYPTSYIPNHSGGTITRGADAMQIASGISDLLPQGTGTMYVEATIEDAVNTEGYLMRIEQASFANTIFIARSVAGNLFVSYRNNNSTIFSFQKNNVADTLKAAFAFESGNSVLYVNGEQIDTSSVTYTPAVTYDDLRVGGYSANTANMSGVVSQALVFKTRLSNADLATLTTI
jgi:hypothetical protein